MAKTRQVAALPWQQRNGGIEYLLVTTRTTRRWVIPKGWPMQDRADHQAAEQEALEEAGVIGRVSALPMGQFNYLKTTDSGKTRMLKVDVYPLEVTDELENWLEKPHRERRWMTQAEARQLSGEPELVGIFERFDASMSAKSAADTHVASMTKPKPTLVSVVIAWLKGQPLQ